MWTPTATAAAARDGRISIAGVLSYFFIPSPPRTQDERKMEKARYIKLRKFYEKKKPKQHDYFIRRKSSIRTRDEIGTCLRTHTTNRDTEYVRTRKKTSWKIIKRHRQTNATNTQYTATDRQRLESSCYATAVHRWPHRVAGLSFRRGAAMAEGSSALCRPGIF